MNGGDEESRVLYTVYMEAETDAGAGVSMAWGWGGVHGRGGRVFREGSEGVVHAGLAVLARGVRILLRGTTHPAAPASQPSSLGLPARSARGRAACRSPAATRGVVGNLALY